MIEGRSNIQDGIKTTRVSANPSLPFSCTNIRNFATGQSPVKEVCERIAQLFSSALRRASHLRFRVDVDASRRVASRRAASRRVASRRVASRRVAPLANLDE